MSVYKRGRLYWYEFVWRVERIRQPTKQTNKRVAEQMEAAHKTALAKGEVGIRDRARIPTLRQFEDRFVKAIETDLRQSTHRDALLWPERGTKSGDRRVSPRHPAIAPRCEAKPPDSPASAGAGGASASPKFSPE